MSCNNSTNILFLRKIDAVGYAGREEGWDLVTQTISRMGSCDMNWDVRHLKLSSSQQTFDQQ